jgi:hypothetical protein
MRMIGFPGRRSVGLSAAVASSGTVGFDDKVDRQAVGRPCLAPPGDGHQCSSGSDQARGPFPDVTTDEIEMPMALEEAARCGAGSLAVHFTIEGTTRRLPAEVEDTIFRVAQESTLNVVKHAQASRISMTLAYTLRARA